jgi:WhiB family redox-sensing transcriptional regulator
VRPALVIDGPTPCKDDPDLFFPRSERAAKHEPAKRLCLSCLHTADCLAWALENDERWGVWGGTSPHDRHRLQHARGAS